ncbi:MAG: dTDP-4-dehydrorhamnose 3,5-epimerase family protein [Candidatus Diapherotrites archaeon]|nr:dTDP-4-dehydrorhamnose 3,5-epimerase family protein [Candidatus Diapherotrites archaeon]
MSEGLPEGVVLKSLVRHKDARGYFQELYRESWFNMSAKQVSVSVTHPGIIKAFHWHKYQTDIFCLISGKVLIGLYDLRKESPTFGVKKALVVDADAEPVIVSIPCKVVHGYKVLGQKDAVMLYIMDNEYNPDKPDEERIPFDDSKIGFDWSQA